MTATVKEQCDSQGKLLDEFIIKKRKVQNKMNPFLKSSEPDLKKLLSTILTIHKNVLYLTYQVDKVRRDISLLQDDKALQKQANDFYDADPPNVVHPDDVKDLD